MASFEFVDEGTTRGNHRSRKTEQGVSWSLLRCGTSYTDAANLVGMREGQLRDYDVTARDASAPLEVMSRNCLPYATALADGLGLGSALHEASSTIRPCSFLRTLDSPCVPIVHNQRP